MQVIQPFQYLIATTELNNVNLSDFNKFAKSIYNQNPSVVKSNAGGYQSANLLDLPEMKELSERLTKSIRAYVGYFQFKQKPKMTNLWLSINNTKDYNVLHDHPQSKISGVFYTNAPPDSGDLIFSNPVETEHFFNNEELNEFNLYNCGKYAVKPKDGMIVIFPSFLKHEVGPNLTKNRRISFSFNFA